MERGWVKRLDGFQLHAVFRRCNDTVCYKPLMGTADVSARRLCAVNRVCSRMTNNWKSYGSVRVAGPITFSLKCPHSHGQEVQQMGQRRINLMSIANSSRTPALWLNYPSRMIRSRAKTSHAEYVSELCEELTLKLVSKTSS